MSGIKTDQRDPGYPAFAKLCGAGNDFIVVYAESGSPALPSAEIVRLCDRRYGVGADGLMVLRPGEGGPAFEVDFYNADGSGGVLCGNGARCALERARALGLVQVGVPARFRFAGKDYRGTSLAAGRASFELNPRFYMESPRLIRVGDYSLRGRFVDVGSPHFVVDLGSILDSDSGRAFGSLDELPVDQLGRAVRQHRDFGPAGVNANFSDFRDGRLYVRTFERGVEAETLACGTGSTASALVRWRDGEARPPVLVVARSGDELVVDFDPAEDGLSRLSLAGPAIQTFTGRL